jgi:glycogen debranching enzyme
MIMKSLKIFLSVLLLFVSITFAQSGFINKFGLKKNNIEITRLAQPNQYFDKIGRKAALMGYENGSFEMWVWPWKVLRNFDLQFFIGSSTAPILSKDILRTISVSPEATTITFTYESFRVKEIIFIPVNEPCAIILLDVYTTQPLSIVPGFIPVLQPQWPAGIGGQYSYWDDDQKAYVISESRGRATFLCGSPAGKQMTAPPAHMFADNPIQFRIDIKPGETKGKYIPIAIAGGDKMKFDSVKTLYNGLMGNAEKFYEQNYEHFQDLTNNTIKVETPNKKFNLAYEWGKVALDNLLVKNPNLGEGLVAGYGLSGLGGRPGFAWFFGGDAFINSLAFNSFQDFSTVKDALKFVQKWQRQDNFPIRKKSPDEVNNNIGKIAHELSQSEGLIDWWNDYHYGYNHADTTPWYLVAFGDYYMQSGDLTLVKESWKSIKQAYEWCVGKDSDNDGLMDLKGAGLGALEFGKYVHIYADMYTSAIWTKAIEAVIKMSNAVGDAKLKSDAEKELQKALKSIDEKFWMPDMNLYSYGATEKGEQVKEKTPWPTIGIAFNVLNDQHSDKSMPYLNNSDLCTDWGIRSLSNKSGIFDPLNYNYGAIWPFIASFFGRAQYNYHYNQAGYKTIESVANHFFDNAAGVVPEVFSGQINQKLSEAYQDQGFSATGFIEPFVRGLLGLKVDGPNKTIYFSPNLPADWKNISITNIKVGKDIVDFHLYKENGRLKLSAEKEGYDEIKVEFSPALGLGTEIISSTFNSSPIVTKLEKRSQVYLANVTLPLNGKNEYILNIKAVPEIYFLEDKTESGETNRGLKVTSQELAGNILNIHIEGLRGETYQLGVSNSDKIISVTGAELKGNILFIKISNTNVNHFVDQDISIIMK